MCTITGIPALLLVIVGSVLMIAIGYFIGCLFYYAGYGYSASKESKKENTK